MQTNNNFTFFLTTAKNKKHNYTDIKNNQKTKKCLCSGVGMTHPAS